MLFKNGCRIVAKQLLMYQGEHAALEIYRSVFYLLRTAVIYIGGVVWTQQFHY